jgi:hypothetical protein
VFADGSRKDSGEVVADFPWFNGTTRRILTVFQGKSVTSSPIWSRVVPKAVKAFTDLFRTLKLNVGLTLASQTDQPEAEANHYGGADIWVEALEQFEFPVAGQKVNVNLINDPFVRGHTRTLAWDFGKGQEVKVQIRKACILMRPSPQSDDFPRRVGNSVLVVWTVHEFIHAIGLSDHTQGAGDLFEANPSLRSGTRDDPESDKLEVRGGARIPPITTLTGNTINRIQKIWP